MQGRTLLLLSIVFGVVSLAACKGPAGPAGEKGGAGGAGNDSLVKTSTEAAGSNCPFGGVKIESGVDANGNDVLDPGEVDATATTYACSVAPSGSMWPSTGVKIAIAPNGVSTATTGADHGPLHAEGRSRLPGRSRRSLLGEHRDRAALRARLLHAGRSRRRQPADRLHEDRRRAGPDHLQPVARAGHPRRERAAAPATTPTRSRPPRRPAAPWGWRTTPASWARPTSSGSRPPARPT